MQDRKTQDQETKKNVERIVIDYHKDYIKQLNISIDLFITIFGDEIKTIPLIQKAYNRSAGDIQKFIAAIKAEFKIDDRFNLILEDGFEAIQNNCGPEFGIETMDALNTAQKSWCSFLTSNNNDRKIDHENFEMLKRFIDVQQAINLQTDETLKIALTETEYPKLEQVLNKKLAARGPQSQIQF